LHWYNWGHRLHIKLARYSEAETAYRESIARDPKHVMSWNNLGGLLRDPLHRYVEAEMAFRAAIVFGPQYARPWNNLGNLLLNHLAQCDEAETCYREAIARDPKYASPWNGLGNLLQNSRQHYDEAEMCYREAIARDPQHAWPWSGLGNLYCDCMGRFNEAAEAFDTALRLDPSNDIIHQNRLFLRRDFMGEGAAARPLMAELVALPKHSFQDTTHLHEALFAAYDANWGLACDALAKALAIRDDGFAEMNTDDWLRTSAVLLHLNYGAELLSFLEQRGDNVRLRPWVEALRALQIGDRRALQNVAPEIRVTAEVFYDGIEQRLLKLPAKTRRRPL
jgi:tetratricopeptide (TPR) repeat protein